MVEIEFELYNYDKIPTSLVYIRNNTYRLVTGVPEDIQCEFKDDGSHHLKWLYPCGGPYFKIGGIVRDVGMKVKRMIKTTRSVYIQFEDEN